MKKTILLMALVVATGQLFAQKKTTSSATVTFDATTAKDALPKATNNTVIGSLNTATGDVAFEASVKNFAFTNPKIQEHFNSDKWMNSDTYPVFSFSGKIEKLSKVNFNKDGVYEVTVNGIMKVRDISKKEKMEVTVTIIGGKIKTSSSFEIDLPDYGITGAPIDAGKVAKEPKVTVSAEF
ncbi:MAG: YceI family protein [Chitinophagaceae bacterium]